MQTTKKVLAITVMPDKRGRGRPPLADGPMTHAEKQKRHRAKIAAEAEAHHARFLKALDFMDSVMGKLSEIDRFEVQQAKTEMQDAFDQVLVSVSQRHAVRVGKQEKA